jgi:hypothetical protein
MYFIMKMDEIGCYETLVPSPRPQGIISQVTNVRIFTSVKTLNLIKEM